MSETNFTLIDDGRAVEVAARISGDSVRLSPATVHAALGWELKPEGLCQGAVCVPVRDRAALLNADGIDLAALAHALQRPLALEAGERVAYLAASAAERGAQLASLQAPDVALPALDGTLHRIADYRGKKVLLVAHASWCGCRYDLPAWQQLYAELKDYGFVVITVALDKSLEDARPWIEAAQAAHPSLVDTEHRLADLYGMVNVPTVVWIDEAGRIVRPNAAAFGSEIFKDLTGFDSPAFLDAVRAWVKNGTGALSADEARQQLMLPSPDEQLAKAHFGLGWHLHQAGRGEAAARHFARAGELSPDDFTVRRAAMPIQGIDPMVSPEFLQLFNEWTERGRPYYRPRS
ncbi:MAG: TlpA disulfide reductase family protein [bacterium]